MSNFLDPDDKEFFYGNTVGPIDKEKKMKKNITITLQDVTKQDLRDAFHQAIDELGVKGGDQIPKDMFNLREQVMDILFSGESVRPIVRDTRPTLTEDQIHDMFKSGV